MNFRKQFLVKPGAKVVLANTDPKNTYEFKNKASAREQLKKNTKRLQELQYTLYAEDRRSVLIVLQGIDSAGKDGTIRHVMRGLNPQGCQVTPFKAPSKEELDHDFLWRIHKKVPRRGEIGVFNRSHYEDVLIVRVHELVPESTWSKRYGQINRFESNLADNGVTILKFFIYISEEEQRERLQARIDDPRKHWKFNPNDLKERARWDDYIPAYEEALMKCSKSNAPWFIIPSDKKWFRNLAVSQILCETLDKMNVQLPKPTFDPSEHRFK